MKSSMLKLADLDKIPFMFLQIWTKSPSCFCRPRQISLHVFADPDKIPFMFLQTRTKFPSCFCRPRQNSLHVFADPDKIPFMFLQTRTKFPSCFCRPGQSPLQTSQLAQCLETGISSGEGFVHDSLQDALIFCCFINMFDIKCIHTAHLYCINL